jgi:hypothetical protein
MAGSTGRTQGIAGLSRYKRNSSPVVKRNRRNKHRNNVAASFV